MDRIKYSFLMEKGDIPPFIHYPVFQVTGLIVTEVVKIAAAKIFLDLLVKYCFREPAKLLLKDIYEIVVLSPVIEEVIFRGLVLNTIHVMQIGVNKIQKKEPTKTEEKTKQVFRVHLQAFFFAAAHLNNAHKNLIQFSIAYIGGISYGYLTEKYKTLSVSILAHGWGNMLVVMSRLGYLYPPIFIPAIVINEYITYQWAKKDQDE